MNVALKLKVCGMKYDDNIMELASCTPDYIGFIFYQKSKRYVDGLDAGFAKSLVQDIKKVGVFVNEDFGVIRTLSEKYGISVVQLHGDETAEQCRLLKESGLEVIKAFSMEENFDFTKLKDYCPACHYFLFDTKGENFGGTGKMFDWGILQKYPYDVPFFLSGGIDPGSVERIRNLSHPQLYAVDINSRFEISPGFKDIQKIKSFRMQLLYTDPNRTI